MKKTIIMALMAVASVSASAQQKQTIEIPSWLSNVKLSGYGMTQYQYNGQKDAESNSFNIRMARISLEGRIAGDFYWKAQLQVNGNTLSYAFGSAAPRTISLYATDGRLVKRAATTAANGTVSLAGLQRGLYLATTGMGSSVKVMVK